MADRFYEDLGITHSSHSEQITDQCTRLACDGCREDEEDTEGEYEEDVEEEVNGAGKEGKSEELACPFCSEDFDVLGLCCHIDADHRMEVKTGICPLCSTKVRINMASHVITQHQDVLKAFCIKKGCSARSRSVILLLRKDVLDKHLRRIKESPSVDSSYDVATDSKLLSFVHNPHHGRRPQTNQTASSTKTCLSAESVNGELPERIQLTPPTDWHIERTRRCEFSQGLVLSTIFGDL